MNIKFTKTLAKNADTLILPVYEGDKTLKLATAALDATTLKFIETRAAKSKSFKAKHGTTYAVNLPDGAEASCVILLGLGKAEDLSPVKAQDAGGKLQASLKGSDATEAHILLEAEHKTKALAESELAANIAYGMTLRAYTFDLYKSKKKDDESASADIDVTFVLDAQKAAQDAYTPLSHVAEGVFAARNFVNEPPNALYPESYANAIKDQLKPLGVSVEILDEKKMLKMGMGAIMAVGQGSERQPRMVIMKWNGGAKSKAPLMLVGKGVTFDTGGISIKPGAGMDEMKMDMGGSAAVVGTMKAIALRKSKANVVAIVGLAENMPSHNAYRPGDIVKSYSGKTIEVLNTDAEGRLVLADCLTYGQEIAKPAAIIDLATLTGAMMVALGHEYCGSFVNNDQLWSKMESSSTRTGEKLWRMPLDEVFKKDMEGSFGDLQNLGKSGRFAGACTAAGFLEHFINDGTAWAHMDIAGTAWIKGERPTVPKFGTGFGVRVLNDLIAEYYE